MVTLWSGDTMSPDYQHTSHPGRARYGNMLMYLTTAAPPGAYPVLHRRLSLVQHPSVLVSTCPRDRSLPEAREVGPEKPFASLCLLRWRCQWHPRARANGP
jgi:hypothetical protein|eukprot:COSAG06_NODE_632_length_13608_cov_26.746613_17_plen_101_part_00